MRWVPKHARPRTLFGSRRSGVITVTAGACVCIVAGGGIWTAVAHDHHAAGSPGGALSLSQSTTPASSIPAPSPDTSTNTGTNATQSAAVRPTWIDIPSIKLHTTLQLLGLDSAGSLNPPTNLTQAGWYTGSAVPGQDGPAIIAGHVDSVSGPAVFFALKSLSPGDTITVGLSSGQTVAFRATVVQRYAKAQFPTAAVYGARPDPELRLITCGGDFAAGHYLDNVVVYAAESGT
jgi:sortase (surface protein transpeptidase)